MPITESCEDIAWSLISRLSFQYVLQAQFRPTLTKIPAAVVSLFQQCCSIPLQEIAAEPRDSSGWFLLFLLPRMLLSPTRRGGRLRVIELRSVFQKFLSYRWEELLQLNQRSKKSDHFPSDYQTKVALKLIRQGELSRAARMLTSNGLVPESEETVSKLKSKHPARRSDPHYQPPPVAGDTGLILDQHTLMQAIRKAPRGSSAGPSGWRYEHLKCLIGINETADLLSSACNSIAQGHLPPFSYFLLHVSLLFLKG